MAWFPFFMDVSQGDGLIVGGGTVALRKIEKLLPYQPRLTVCAPAFLPEIEGIPSLTLLRGAFEPFMVEEKLFVIAATGDHGLNRQISGLCREKGIPVNAVDDRSACTFLFPALVKRGPLSIGISTGGASPSGAVYWKQRIANLIPEDAGDLLEYLDGLRATVKQTVPDEKDRAVAFAALLAPAWKAAGRCLRRRWSGFCPARRRDGCERKAWNGLSGGRGLRRGGPHHPAGPAAAGSLRHGGLRRSHRPGLAGRGSCAGGARLHGQAGGPPLRRPGGYLCPAH